jgi:transcriptional regulator with XRE-family HTH domain
MQANFPDTISDLSFPEALSAAKEHQGWSFRDLERRTREIDGRGLSHTYLQRLAKGLDVPSLRTAELVARACDIDPEVFAEYRIQRFLAQFERDDSASFARVYEMCCELDPKVASPTASAAQRS